MMSQQALDLRSSIQAVRRHRRLFGAIVALGLLLGAVYAVFDQPMTTSSALVALPQAAAQVVPDQASNQLDTQMLVAGSGVVLEDALPHIKPSMTLQVLDTRVSVTNPAGSILSINGSGRSAAEAESIANAVAQSYISYTSSAGSAAGAVPARLLASATSATNAKLPARIAIYGLLGVIVGIVVGFIVAIATSSNDRRLRKRDAIANSVGVPVLAALPVARPADATAWARLMQEYQPGAVSGWALIRLLRHLGVVDAKTSNKDTGNGASEGSAAPLILAVLSLATDQKALALGPQLAAFAAAQGVRTGLVLLPHQDTAVTAALRTACAAPVPAQSSTGQHKPLRLAVSEDGTFDRLDDALIVVVAVLDDTPSPLPDALGATVTLLGVSAGAATAEQLAQAATVAAAHGEVAGFLIADPDPSDQSTGRMPRLAPPAWRQAPTRVNDVPTEIKR
jgi:capsular polysaccharide biosynthesis protein